MGLLAGVERYLQLPKGDYGGDSLLLLLAFMALRRIESIESLRYSAPGEWGNLLGLDRVPEVRALYTTEADLLADPAPGTLTVRLHHGANAATDQVIEKLCAELNATEAIFPRTNLPLVLKLGSM